MIFIWNYQEVNSMKRKMIQFAAAGLAAITILASAPFAFAAECEPVPVTASAPGEEGITPQDTDLVWYKRTYQGKTQKRLWSNKLSCWLTDWIDCD